MPITSAQQKVINHSNGNILVSASAGSGKTFTMIERVIRLITEENVNVSEILCVTFTEKAAFEMKEKLKKALIERIQINDDERLKNQLSEVATADISTLHAFCAKLIRTYFFTAGVSLDFNILDEGDAMVLKFKSVEKTFKEFYESGEKWFYTLVDRHAVSRSDKKLKETILEAHAFCHTEADPNKLMQVGLERYDEQGFSAMLREYKVMFDSKVNSLKEQIEPVISAFEVADFEKGLTFAKTLLSDMERAISAQDFYEIKDLADYKLPASFGRIKDETIKEYKDSLMAVRDEFVKLLKKYFKGIGDSEQEDFDKLSTIREHTQWFLRVLTRFGEIYAQEKQDENALDFNDLEHFALKVLSDEQVVDEVKSKYKYVFIDEYQDTNGVQESIVDKIQNDNLFMVGDVKQSIYGFRGCRSEFFIHKDKLMSAKGQAVVRLNENFRSAENVVKMVNRIFSYCMTENVYGENYAERSYLRYGGTFAEDALGRAQLHFLEQAEKEEKKEELPRVYDILQEKPKVKQNHTSYVSALVTKIINEELEKEIYDAKLKSFRRVDYGDIVILTRNKDGAYIQDLISGLVRRGVPVKADAEVNVLDYPEIQTMVNVLKLVDCFSQDVPLVSTLKSPIANVSDEELMDISLAFRDDGKRGNFFEAYRHYINNYQTPLKEKLKAFDNYFNQLRMVADFIGAHGVLQKVINQNNFNGYLLAQAGGNEKILRLNRFVSASIVNDKKLTVKEFLYRIEVCKKAFGISEFSSENTVKAMTIHASKGLEFAVVIVCGLERPFNSEEDYKDVLFDRNYGFAVKDYNDYDRTKEETVLRGLIREKFKDERTKEEARLFYVALTRAQYSLHMIFSAKEDKRKTDFVGANSFLDFVPAYLPVTVHTEGEFYLENQLENQTRKVLIGKADSVLKETMSTRFSYTYPHILDTSLPLKYSVTTAVKEEKQDYYPTYVLLDGETTDIERGNIAHKFLEHYDFYSDQNIVEQAERILGEGLIAKEDLNKINLQRLEKAIKSTAFSDLKDAVLYREKSFLVQIPAKKLIGVDSDENILLQGIIDLLAVKGDKAYIIDYKYSSLDDKSLKARYKKQLELYTYAVESALGLKVTGKALVNLFTGDTVVF